MLGIDIMTVWKKENAKTVYKLKLYQSITKAVDGIVGGVANVTMLYFSPQREKKIPEDLKRGSFLPALLKRAIFHGMRALKGNELVGTLKVTIGKRHLLFMKINAKVVLLKKIYRFTTSTVIERTLLRRTS